MASCCGDGNEPSGSMKGGEFLDQLCDHRILKDSATWSYLGSEFVNCVQFAQDGIQMSLLRIPGLAELKCMKR
jgi:hypothetical protein